ncbi:MAG: ribbon-helix-helix protein, CopG family [Euzebya sp.]
MSTRRTTVTAAEADLATLEAEARRRGQPLAALMREAVQEKAAQLRQRRQPRIGVAASNDGRSASEVTADPVAHPPF